jgi:hypothetical protein
MAVKHTRLLERALKERWPIALEMREQVVSTLANVMGDPGASPREKVAAARALVSAGKANLDSVRTATLIKRVGQDDARFEGAQEDSESLKELVALIRARTDEPDEPPPWRNGRGP